MVSLLPKGCSAPPDSNAPRRSRGPLTMQHQLRPPFHKLSPKEQPAQPVAGFADRHNCSRGLRQPQHEGSKGSRSAP
jgi:hypothetical protein